MNQQLVNDAIFMTDWKFYQQRIDLFVLLGIFKLVHLI